MHLFKLVTLNHFVLSQYLMNEGPTMAEPIFGRELLAVPHFNSSIHVLVFFHRGDKRIRDTGLLKAHRKVCGH